MNCRDFGVPAALVLMSVAVSRLPAVPPPAAADGAAPPAVASDAAARGAAPTQEVVVADFSKGFALLHTLGISNVAKAAYVKLNAPGVYSQYGAQLGLSGNAWQLSGDATNGVFLCSETMLVCAIAAPRPPSTNRLSRMEMLRRMRYGGDDEGGGDEGLRTVYGATWKPADLTVDIPRLLERMEKMVAKHRAAIAKEREQRGEEVEEDLPMGGERRQQTIFGYDIQQWVFGLLFAAHLADQGHLAEANRVAAYAMILGGGNQQLLEAVMNQMGDAEYHKVWLAFEKSGDWNAYAAGVETVARRFTRGWQQKAAAADLARRIRLAAERPPAAADRPGTTPEQQALARALATAPACAEANQAFNETGFWLLPRSTNDEIGIWIATNAHPLARLLRGGTNSLPLLLALAEDKNTFTRLQTVMPLQPTHAPGAAPGDSAADAEDDGTEAQRRMRIMQMKMQMDSEAMRGGGLVRPALRSEVATHLLEKIVGGGSGEYDNTDPFGGRGGRSAGSAQPLAERVHAWGAAHAGMDAEALALDCLTNRDANLCNIGAQYLIENGSPAARRRLEQQILAQQPRALCEAYLGIAQNYVNQRGKETKAFVTALEAKVAGAGLGTNAVKGAGAAGPEEEDLFRGGDTAQNWQIQQLHRALREMRMVVDARPLAVLVEEVATGRKSPAANREEIQRAIQTVPYGERLTAVVRGAVQAQTPDLRLALLGMARKPEVSPNAALQMEMAGVDEATAAEMFDEYGRLVAFGAGRANAKPPAPPVVAELAEAWRALLADPRVSTNRAANYWRPPLRVRDLAALIMENAYGDGTGTVLRAFHAADELGDQGLAILTQRAEARLTGAPVQPALPDPKRVAAVRLATLTNALLRAAPADCARQAAALDIHERVALARAARQDPALAAALAAVAHRMQAVLDEATPASARGALQACDGRMLNAAALQELVKRCAAQAAQGEPVTFVLLRRAGFAGVTVAARATHPADAVGDDSTPGVAVGYETLDSSPDTLVLQPDRKITTGNTSAAEDPLKRPTDAELIAAEAARLMRGPMSAADFEASFWKRIETFCASDPAVGFPGGFRVAPNPVAVPGGAARAKPN